MSIRAVLFDFDGTLADSYDAITASVNHVRAAHGLPALATETVRSLVGHGLDQLMADIVPNGDPAADAHLYRAHHPTIMVAHTRLLPGVLQALQTLQARGVRMAVCSNKPSAFTTQLVAGLSIATYFDAILGPEDAGKPKPDPAMIDLARQRLGVGRDETLYIGDMQVDVETARSAGVAVWVVVTGSDDLKTLKRSSPDRIMRGMNELIPALFEGAEPGKTL